MKLRDQYSVGGCLMFIFLPLGGAMLAALAMFLFGKDSLLVPVAAWVFLIGIVYLIDRRR